MDPNTQTPNTQSDDQSGLDAGQSGPSSTGSAQPRPGTVTSPPTSVGGSPASGLSGMPAGPSGQPTQPTPTPSFSGGPDATYGGGSFSSTPGSGGGSGRKKLLTIVILIVVVIALGVGGYFGYKALKKQNQKDTVNNAFSQSTAKSKASGATDIGTLTSLTFNLPASAATGMTAQPSANPNAKLYKTSDGNCIILYGTGNSSFLPGSSVTDITNAYLDNLRKLPNANVNGPTAADPRIIADASNASKKYSIPSLTFSVSQNKSDTKGYYSAALLKNGDRVIVETACTNPDGAVDQSRMDAMEAVAKQLTITVQ